MTLLWVVILVAIVDFLAFQAIQNPTIVQQATNWVTITLAVVASLPATVSAIIAGMVLFQSRRNAEVVAKTELAVVQNISKTDTVIEKATEIHTLTNSNLSKVQSQLDVANVKIDSFNTAQEESARRMANMELLITSLISSKGEQSPSEANGAKLVELKEMLTEVKDGTPPIPVRDEAVLAKLDDVVIGKLDEIKGTVDEAKDNSGK